MNTVDELKINEKGLQVGISTVLFIVDEFKDDGVQVYNQLVSFDRKHWILADDNFIFY